jgi:hypothetical protein
VYQSPSLPEEDVEEEEEEAPSSYHKTLTIPSDKLLEKPPSFLLAQHFYYFIM